MKPTVTHLFHLAEDCFDAGPLEGFCRTHEVKGWVQHFFMDGGCPRLALVLEYEEVADALPSGRAQRSERDFRRELPTPARPAYDRLRDWRSLRARQVGVPVYVVFNNRELAAIAGTMPANNEALRSIEGIGKGKANLVAAAGRAARGKCGSPEVDDLHDSCGGIVTTGPGRGIPVGSPGRGV